MAHDEKQTQRVMIASANPLFGKGLEKMLLQSAGGSRPEIRLTNNMAKLLVLLQEWKPELVIVDYDDQTIDRVEFLNHFVATDLPMKVMLISLQASGEVVVYDRRSLTPAQAEDWLQISSKTARNKRKGAQER